MKIQRYTFQAWETVSLNRFIWAEKAHENPEATCASTIEWLFSLLSWVLFRGKASERKTFSANYFNTPSQGLSQATWGFSGHKGRCNVVLQWSLQQPCCLSALLSRINCCFPPVFSWEGLWLSANKCCGTQDSRSKITACKSDGSCVRKANSRTCLELAFL